jgi:hypothetical protein
VPFFPVHEEPPPAALTRDDAVDSEEKENVTLEDDGYREDGADDTDDTGNADDMDRTDDADNTDRTDDTTEEDRYPADSVCAEQ